MTESFFVELKRHVDTMATARGPVPVDLHQSYVLLNGTHVGYICDHDGAPLNLIVALDDVTRERLRAEVERLRGEKPIGRVSQVPAIEAPEPEEIEIV